jgi:hypothetical protein
MDVSLASELPELLDKMAQGGPTRGCETSCRMNTHRQTAGFFPLQDLFHVVLERSLCCISIYALV